MKDISYNKSLSSYSNLTKTQFTSIDNNFDMTDNGVVTDFSFNLNNNETLASYAVIGNRVLDCKTNTDDSGKQHIEFSVSSTEISNLSKITLYTISKDEKKYSEIEVTL